MTPTWTLFSLLGPPLAAVAAGIAFRSKDAPAELTIVLNALMPGAGLAAGGRPLLEVALCVMFAQASLFAAGGVKDLPFLVPSMLIGAAWALLHTPFNPLTADKDAPTPSSDRGIAPAAPAAAEVQRSAPTTRPATAAGPSRAQGRGKPESEPETGYSVAVRCTECGADVEVPVLEHMAHCEFCGSDHLVVGHEDTLFVTIPERVQSTDDLKEAVLDHYRYQYYLKLYKRSVAPLEAGSTDVTASGMMVTRPETTAAIEAAEAAVSRRADAYRSQLATKLELGQTSHFLAPYLHGIGTLYQAAFGRSTRDQEKQLRFAIGTVEAATLATTTVELPDMGKLSYLRALIPAAKFGDVAQALPMDRDESALQTAYGNLDRKQLVRDINVIRLGSVFAEEVKAVVWRPWWIAEVRAPSIHDTLLVDSAAGSVASHAPTISKEILEPLPDRARDPGCGLRFLPMQCPTCGYEFSFEPSAVLHFCLNCHRVFEIHRDAKREVDYGHVPVDPESTDDIVPFWEFPLRIRTGDGQTLIDLSHLRDGIDGTLDQIGDDAVARQSRVYLPAVRFINSRLMATAFNKLFVHTLRKPPSVSGGRYELDDKPQPWSVSLAETEARRFAPLYLANAFAKRDIARVKVNQVASWLFEATEETGGRLTYLPVPRSITEPFRRYTGHFQARAVQEVTKKGTQPGRL